MSRVLVRHLLALPILRAEVPGWGVLFRYIESSTPEQTWRDAPVKFIRGKRHHYTMRCNLSNWSERFTYMLGRFYDLATLLALDAILRPGDRVLDVGANIGMITLEAAYLVGPTGRVDSFEPNPRCIDRLREHRELNKLTQMHVHPFALSDTDSTETLSVITDHDGMGTLAPVTGPHADLVSRQFSIETKVGDNLIDDRRVALIKIDVEGFEIHVIGGLKATIARDQPIILTEFDSICLQRAGATRMQLYDLMSGLGYEAYAMHTERRLLAHRLRLRHITRDDVDKVGAADAMWIHNVDQRAKSLCGPR